MVYRGLHLIVLGDLRRMKHDDWFSAGILPSETPYSLGCYDQKTSLIYPSQPYNLLEVRNSNVLSFYMSVCYIVNGSGLTVSLEREQLRLSSCMAFIRGPTNENRNDHVGLGGPQAYEGICTK